MKFEGTLFIDVATGIMHFCQTNGPVVVRVQGLDDLHGRNWEKQELSTIDVLAGAVCVTVTNKKK